MGPTMGAPLETGVAVLHRIYSFTFLVLWQVFGTAPPARNASIVSSSTYATSYYTHVVLLYVLGMVVRPYLLWYAMLYW